jgi:hypothetical protein
MNTSTDPLKKPEDKKSSRKRWLLLLLLLLLLSFFGIWLYLGNSTNYTSPSQIFNSGQKDKTSGAGIEYPDRSDQIEFKIGESDSSGQQQVKVVLNPPTLPVKVLNARLKCKKTLCAYEIDLLNQSKTALQIEGTIYALKHPTHVVGQKELPVKLALKETRKYTGALSISNQPDGIMLYVEEIPSSQ